MIFDPAPVSVILAALVTMLAPLNCSDPVILYVPPVSVPEEKFARLPFTTNFVPPPTERVPLLVKFPAVVKLRPLPMLKLPVGIGGERREKVRAAKIDDPRAGTGQRDVGCVGYQLSSWSAELQRAADGISAAGQSCSGEVHER